MTRILRHLGKYSQLSNPANNKFPHASDRTDWKATHRHRKGGLYRVLGRGTLEADRSPVVIYDDAAGEIWVRSAKEFDDGRFEPIL